jgi:hypothetical protein
MRPRREPRPVGSRLHCLKPNPERMINGPAATSVRRRRVSGAGRNRLAARQDLSVQLFRTGRATSWVRPPGADASPQRRAAQRRARQGPPRCPGGRSIGTQPLRPAGAAAPPFVPALCVPSPRAAAMNVKYMLNRTLFLFILYSHARVGATLRSLGPPRSAAAEQPARAGAGPGRGVRPCIESAFYDAKPPEFQLRGGISGD